MKQIAMNLLKSLGVLIALGAAVLAFVAILRGMLWMLQNGYVVSIFTILFMMLWAVVYWLITEFPSR